MTRPNTAQQLIDLGRLTPLFHDPDGVPYATVPVGDHHETWPLRSSGFRAWIAARYWETYGTSPRAQAVADALLGLEGLARFEGPEEAVHVRLAFTEGALYLDLGDAAWRVVAVTAGGWQVVSDPPVRFRRPKGLTALPDPVRGGSLELLRPLLNLDAGADE